VVGDAGTDVGDAGTEDGLAVTLIGDGGTDDGLAGMSEGDDGTVVGLAAVVGDAMTGASVVGDADTVIWVGASVTVDVAVSAMAAASPLSSPPSSLCKTSTTIKTTAIMPKANTPPTIPNNNARLLLSSDSAT